MPRTTEEAVAAICELDDEIPLAPFIETANAIVTEVCLDSGYGDNLLELIERWLSAHFYCIRDPRAHNEQVKGIIQTFEGRTYTGFRHTSYGQQAMMLDFKGNLKVLDNMSKTNYKASVLYVGGPEC